MSRVTSAILICDLFSEKEELLVLDSVNEQLKAAHGSQEFKIIPSVLTGGTHHLGQTLMAAGFNHIDASTIEEAVRNATYPLGTKVMLLTKGEEDDFFELRVKAIFRDPDIGTIWASKPRLVDEA